MLDTTRTMQHAYACIIIPSLPWHANWECWSCSFDPTRSLWFCAMSDKLLSDKSDKVAICIYQATFIWSHPIFSYQLNLITACLLHREYMTNMQFFLLGVSKNTNHNDHGAFPTNRWLRESYGSTAGCFWLSLPAICFEYLYGCFQK